MAARSEPSEEECYGINLLVCIKKKIFTQNKPIIAGLIISACLILPNLSSNAQVFVSSDVIWINNCFESTLNVAYRFGPTEVKGMVYFPNSNYSEQTINGRLHEVQLHNRIKYALSATYGHWFLYFGGKVISSHIKMDYVKIQSYDQEEGWSEYGHQIYAVGLVGVRMIKDHIRLGLEFNNKSIGFSFSAGLKF